MSKFLFNKPSKLFLILSLVIICLDMTFVGITFFQSRNTLVSNLEKESLNQHATYRALFKESAQNMLQIATFVAHDSRIQQAFLKGKQAVEQEGGGKGKQQASLARKNLLDIVSPSWKEITTPFKARQLHFHLGSDSTSFLRVHKPEKFGDNMNSVRHTIVNTNKQKTATAGFETGKFYSGIRGTLPIFAIDPNTQKQVHVGTVESGISFYSLINNLAQVLDINIAVLLTMEHIQANMWPDFLEKRLRRNPPFGDFVVEETTLPSFREILPLSLIQNELKSKIIKLTYLNNHYYAISEIPLRDYQASLNPALNDSGKIIFWKDVTEAHQTFINNVTNNLIYAAIGFILFEISLSLALYKTTQKPKTIIDQRTAQLLNEISLKDTQAQALKKFSLAVKRNPSATLPTDKFDIIEYNNHKCLELTAYIREDVIEKSSSLLSSGKTAKSTYTHLWDSFSLGKEWLGEFHNHKKNGDYYWANNTLLAIKQNRMALFAQVITPINPQKSSKLRYEILVRQFSIEGLEISPSQFLPALERYNLAVKIDSWVISSTFNFLQAHIDAIANIEYFAINLSGQSLCNIKIYNLIVHCLETQLVPPSKIVFEITETVAIASITDAISFIYSLKKYGCRFALDDFGSGMSSFAYLKKLPVDFLKIDGLFIKDIVEDPIDYAMVKSINEVGHLMGLETIAEFVGDDKILKKLQDINVDYVQGYSLGKPQPLENFFNP